MGDILSQVLRYKQQKESEKALQDMAVPNAINQFIQGQQMARENLLKQQTLAVEAAKSGLKFDQAGNVIKDASLVDPLQKSILDTLKAGGSANVPPGTTVKIGDLTIPLNPAVTDAESKTMATSESLQGQLGDLISLIKNDKNNYDSKTGMGKLGAVLGSSQLLGNIGPKGVGENSGQAYKYLKDSISERLLRLRSGAQINESEYKRFTNLLPSIFRADSLDIKQLENFQNEFAAIEGRIKSGSLWDSKSKSFTNNSSSSETTDIRTQYNNLRNSGVSAEEAKKRLGL